MKHTLRRCLSLVLALATLLSVCVVPLAAANADECNHYNFGYTEIGHQDPTCTEYGGLLVVCNNCSERYVRRETWENPLNHKDPVTGETWLVEVDRKEATYTQDGWVKYECSACEGEVTEVLKAKKCDVCDPEKLLVKNTATCTEPGIKTTTCPTCGYTTQEPSAPLGHTWNNGEIVVEPVCGVLDDPATPENEYKAPVNAEILYTCTRCDAEELKEDIAPVNHKWLWVEENKAGCHVTPGYVCVYCDEQHPTEPYSYTEHDWQNYNDVNDKEHVNKAATCEDGNQWQKCANCGDFQNKTLAADVYGYHVHPNDVATNRTELGLNVDKLIQSYVTHTKDHNCGNPGYMTCSKCGRDDIVDKYDPAQHDYTINVAPTCTEYGYKTCGRCGWTIGYLDPDGVTIHEEYNKLGHILPTTGVQNFPADCTNRGYRIYKCQRPGCTGYDHRGNFIPADGLVYEFTTDSALGHDYELIQKVPATCGVSGVSEYQKCSRCGHEAGKTIIPALVHNYTTQWVKANCLYAAHYGQVCTNCGDEILDPTLMHGWSGERDENAHKWDKTKEKLETKPTCTTPGLSRNYCDICKKEYLIEVEPTGHTMKYVGTVPVTCQNAGYDVFYCTTCQAFEKRNVVEDVPLTELDRYHSHAYYSGVDAGDITLDFDYNAVTGEFTLTETSHTWGTSTFVKFVGNDVFDTTIDPILFCGIYSYEERTCSHCHINYNKRLADVTSGLLTGEHHPISADVAPTCTTPGYKGRTVCERCGTVITPGEILPAWHTLDKNAPDYEGPKAATCTTIGWAEKGTCTVCNLVGAINGKIDELKHQDENGKFTLVLVEARAADCVLFGYDAHYACTQCGYKLLNTKVVKDADGNLVTTGLDWQADFVADLATNADNGYVAPLGHKFDGERFFAPFACGKDGYVWTDCTRDGCSEILVETYTFGYANHRYSDKTYSTNRHVCEDSYNLCQNMVQENAAGEVVEKFDSALIKCLHKDPLSVAAEPHKNAAGEVILGVKDCAEWLAEQDHVCVTCKVDFVKDKIDHKGNAKDTFHKADCLDKKDYKNWSCTVCKQMWVTDVVEYTDPTLDLHVWDGSADYKKATWTEDGYRIPLCGLCGEKGEKQVLKAPDLFFAMDIKPFDETNDKAINSVYFVNGGYMAVTIKVSGSATNFHSIKMSLPIKSFDGEPVLEFVRVQNESVQVGNGSVAIIANADYETVELYAVAENDGNSEPQNINLKGEAVLATLIFKVNPNFYDVDVANTISEITALDFGTTSVLAYEEGKPVAVTDIVYDTVVPANADNYAATVFGKAYAITVYKLGDMNGNGIVNDEDAVYMEKVLFANQYDSRADLDKDGVMSARDFALMKRFLVKMLNYPELAAYDATTAR